MHRVGIFNRKLWEYGTLERMAGNFRWVGVLTAGPPQQTQRTHTQTIYDPRDLWFLALYKKDGLKVLKKITHHKKISR